MKIVFVHGALVLDGAWWWHRMVEPLGALGLGSLAVELPSCIASPGAFAEALGDLYADAVRTALGEADVFSPTRGRFRSVIMRRGGSTKIGRDG